MSAPATLSVPVNWYETFFTGVAVELWREAIPEAHTRAEADRLEALLRPPPGGQVLDVPCGHGRHALELAARGYRVTGVDIAAEEIAEAGRRAAARNRDVTWKQGDMRDLPWPGEFDGAICCGNAFGYLDDAGNAAFLAAVGRALKPGARFVLDYSMVAEGLLPHFQERPWWEGGDSLFLVHQQYDPPTGRVNAEYIFVRDGRVERRPMSQRAYNCPELYRLLAEAGFGDIQAFDGFSPEPFRLGSPNLLLVAARRS